MNTRPVLRRRILCALLLCCAAAPLPGCGKKGGDVPTGVKIGLSIPDGGNPYYKALVDAAQQDAQKRGLELSVADAKGKASEQTRAVEQFLQQGVSVISISAIDPAKLQPALKKATDAKVYLVALEQELEGVEATSLVESNQELAGELAADYLGYRLKGEGKVGILQAAGDPGQEERLESFRSYLKRSYASLQIGASETARDEAAGRAAADRLVAGGADAIFALTDSLGLAAAEAVRAKKADTVVVSYGGSPESVEELRKDDSPLKMTLAIFPQRLGGAAVRIPWRIVSNKPAATRLQQPVLPITRDSAASYPGWDQPLPQELTVPWPSNLTLETVVD